MSAREYLTNTLFMGVCLRAIFGLNWGRGCGLVDRAADSGPSDPSSIPLGEKKENKRKEAGVGPL